MKKNDIYKGKWSRHFVLDNKSVGQITAYLDDANVTGNPYPLLQNADKSFQGSIVLGKGFVLEPYEAARLIEKNPKNKDVLFPYLNGEDLNTNPDQSPSRWVINFFDWPEDKCRKEYPDCFEIVERLVKPVRLKQTGDRGAKYWWQHLRIRCELYRSIVPLERILAITQVSKTGAFCLLSKNIIFDQKVIIIASSCASLFCILQSSFHNNWAWKYGLTMKTDLTYTPTGIFKTFPFIKDLTVSAERKLEQVGEKYHSYRTEFMLKTQLGLTKTYNQFHNRQLAIISDGLSESSIEKKHSKETLNLWKHLSRTANTCPFNEAVADILELRRLHKEMDEAVLKAYGWTDITLAHDFYEVDYLPENDRIRYTISPSARREVLKRLLTLNHKIHAQEMEAEKQAAPASKPRKGKKKETNDNQSSIF